MNDMSEEHTPQQQTTRLCYVESGRSPFCDTGLMSTLKSRYVCACKAIQSTMSVLNPPLLNVFFHSCPRSKPQYQPDLSNTSLNSSLASSLRSNTSTLSLSPVIQNTLRMYAGGGSGGSNRSAVRERSSNNDAKPVAGTAEPDETESVVPGIKHGAYTKSSMQVVGSGTLPKEGTARDGREMPDPIDVSATVRRRRRLKSSLELLKTTPPVRQPCRSTDGASIDNSGSDNRSVLDGQVRSSCDRSSDVASIGSAGTIIGGNSCSRSVGSFDGCIGNYDESRAEDATSMYSDLSACLLPINLSADRTLVPMK